MAAPPIEGRGQAPLPEAGDDVVQDALVAELAGGPVSPGVERTLHVALGAEEDDPHQALAPGLLPHRR
eukprot:scaffold42014_cov25-Prasinocladus_malaysianus.AAC.1